MKTESIKELIDLCRAAQCEITLEAHPNVVFVKVGSTRAGMTTRTEFILHSDDTEMGDKLEAAVRRVQ